MKAWLRIATFGTILLGGCTSTKEPPVLDILAFVAESRPVRTEIASADDVEIIKTFREGFTRTYESVKLPAPPFFVDEVGINRMDPEDVDTLVRYGQWDDSEPGPHRSWKPIPAELLWLSGISGEQPFRWKMPSGVDIPIFTEAEREQLGQANTRNAKYELWKKHFPKFATVCSFSRPSFNGLHTKALIWSYCRFFTSGDAGYTLLEKTAGRWNVSENYSLYDVD